MTSIAFSRLRLLGTATALAAAGWTAQAATWSYTLAPGSLLSGGTLAGTFSGADTDSSGSLSASELVSFDVSYTGVPSVTTSFTIAGTPDAFSFDLADDELTFSVTDASSNVVSVNTYDGGSYAVLSATGPDAGTGPLAISAVPEPSQLAMLSAGLLLWMALSTTRTWRATRRAVANR